VIDGRGRDLGGHGELLLGEMTLLPQATESGHTASFREEVPKTRFLPRW
jgi:hypothetical protein